MAFEMSDQPLMIAGYHYNPRTAEFSGCWDVYIAPYTGLPAGCSEIPPPETGERQVAVFDEALADWQVLDDYRGVIVYNKETQQAEIMTQIGPIPDSVTCLPPPGQFYKWAGDEWIENTQAAEADRIQNNEDEKKRRIAAARATTGEWQSELMLGIISNEDAQTLTTWLDYMRLLKNVDTSAAEVSWPEMPQ